MGVFFLGDGCPRYRDKAATVKFNESGKLTSCGQSTVRRDERGPRGLPGVNFLKIWRTGSRKGKWILQFPSEYEALGQTSITVGQTNNSWDTQYGRQSMITGGGIRDCRCATLINSATKKIVAVFSSDESIKRCGISRLLHRLAKGVT